MKTTILATLLSVTLLSSASYAADESLSSYGFFFKPYVGADYDEYHVNYSNGNGGVFADNFNGGDVHVGARVHKYLGFEVSYFDTASEDNSFVYSGTTLNTSAKLEGWTLDAMGYLPLDESQKFELIGTVGLARTAAKGTARAVSTVSLSDTETKGRIGGGAQYWITDNLNVRGLVRYQDASFGGTIDDAIISTIGLNWQF